MASTTKEGNKMNQRKYLVSAIVLVLGMSGCAQKRMDDDGMHSKRIAELEAKLSASDARMASLKSENHDLKQMPKTVDGGMQMSLATDLYPPNAKPGECYARVLTPAVYSDVSKQILVKGKSDRIEVTPATYTTEEKTVLVKEASEVLKTVPATYKWVEEQYMVEPEKESLETIPATYKTVTEEILVKPAYTTWKKGRGPIEKLDDSTGEIMCLVEIPAEYKTVSRRIVDQAAFTRTSTKPAIYKTVKKRVLAEPARVVKEVIPAEYKTITVKKLATSASERKISIPEEYGTVTERSLVTEAKLEWQSILCETNTTATIINSIQRALNSAGYDVGSEDGVMGARTLSALKKYQTDNGLASGSVTMEALKKLGVY